MNITLSICTLYEDIFKSSFKTFPKSYDLSVYQGETLGHYFKPN